MKFSVVTLFPSLVEGFCGQGLLAGARERGLVRIECVNPREFTSDVHGTVDDRAFGGGDGMVMKCEPLAAAIESVRANARAGPLDVSDSAARSPYAADAIRVIVLSPAGTPWTQSRAREFAQRGGHVVLVCGRYAGIDQRFVEAYADEEISLGDFVLNGGEVAALAMIESVARLIPGVLGNSVSAEQDSFTNNLLEAPQFTRPREWKPGRIRSGENYLKGWHAADGLHDANGSHESSDAASGCLPNWPIPSPLLSGNHVEIAKFLQAVSVVRTEVLRPGTVARGLREAATLVSALTDAELKSIGLSRPAISQLEF